jgi:2-polyprenyl-6-methoxyphenol hydroxylase-like FAD-dependent oxidoreductase
MAISSVIIVGAGPSGLLLALLLSQLDPAPEIKLFDAAPTLNEAPRATHYGSPAIKLFRQAGILEVCKLLLMAPYLRWFLMDYNQRLKGNPPRRVYAREDLLAER